MNIENLTIAEARQIAALFIASNSSLPALPAPVQHPYEIGKPYLIRTVSMIDTGRLVEVTATELVLEDAAWIADTGRFSDALKSCNFNEVEPFPDGRVIINRASIIDAVRISTPQRSQK
jgi:hypothetical protein